MRFADSSRHLLLAGAALASLNLLTSASPAHGVTRTCVANPIVNTQTVLCGSPSGPCTPTSVTLGANIEVTNAPCTFDLGGRDLYINKTFQTTGNGELRFLNAANVSVASTGKLKVRGDFNVPTNETIAGGRISIGSSGTITTSGRLEVTGDGGGTIELTSLGDIILQSGSVILADGISPTTEDGERYADGGILEISSQKSVFLDGALSLTGQNHGQGGTVRVDAARSITLSSLVDASGGAGGGGEVELNAGDHLTITAPIDADSRSGGGPGGTISLSAGSDELGGTAVGGDITVLSTSIRLSGSASPGSSEGYGGDLTASARGAIRLQGTSTSIRANAGSNSTAHGGTIALFSRDEDTTTLSALDGDIEIHGSLIANSGGTSGKGGRLLIDAGRDAVIDSDIELNGKLGGGSIDVTAGRHATLARAIAATATQAVGRAGSVRLLAGTAADGTLRVSADIDTDGGSQDSTHQTLSFSACHLTIDSNVVVSGAAGTSPSSGLSGGSRLRLTARNSMTLNSNARFLVGPSGSITTIHPAATVPVVGSGAVFFPARTDSTNPFVALPRCGLANP